MARAPNLLFLFSDQHAQRVAGCYGDPAALTPNLDRLATQGLAFDNAYCPSPLCVPSRMSMLTARFPSAQECWTNDDYLRSDSATWLHALGAGGYRPVLVGRLHAMGPDQLHGYAERMIGDHSPNWGGLPRHDLGVLDKTNDPWRESLLRSGIGQSAYQVKDVETADAACEYLRSFADVERAGSREPFCLTVGFLLPHPPYVASRADFARVQGGVQPPLFGRVGEVEHAWETWWRENRAIADVADEDILRARTAYYALVHRLDALVGNIMDCLHVLGLDQDTLVVYTTDHGDQLGERGLWWKHTLFEDSIRVPLIMSWPGVLPKGERRHQVCNLIDVAATIVDGLGAPPLPHGQGRSLMPVARDARAAWIDATFCEHCTDSVPAWTGGRAVQQRMLRDGRWKLIYYHGEAPQLFDLATDPHERSDVAALVQHAQLRDAMMARILDDWDPAAIAARIRERRLDKEVIDRWATNVRPPDEFRWQMKPELNYLEASAG